MKGKNMALDGITLHAITEELKEKLTGGKIDRIVQPEKDEITMYIRNFKTTYKLLISADFANPRLHLIAEQNKENPAKAPMFLMLLRKHISGGIITSIAQRSLERVIEFEISAYDEMRVLKDKIMIVEIMGKHSNIIIVDKNDGKIIDSIKRVPLNISSKRELLPGLKYDYPPVNMKANPLIMRDYETFKLKISQNRTAVFKALYLSYEGIGPVAAKELCFRSSINSETNTSELSDIKLERLYNSFDRFFLSISEKRYSPCVIYEKQHGAIKDVSSFYLSMYEDFYTENYTSVHEAVSHFFKYKDTEERMRQRTNDLRKLINSRLETVKHKIEKQSGEMSDALNYEDYKISGELLTSYIYMIKPGLSEITLSNYMDNNKERTIILDPQKSPSENIAHYFYEYRKLKNRITELKSQIELSKNEKSYLEDTLTTLSQVEDVGEISDIKDELFKEGYIKRPTLNKKKSNSISTPRVFYSSDGIKINVGKNNTQNDKLTLKTGKSEYLWLHTKGIPGSHVLVEEDEKKVSECTLKEAALLAAYYSKGRMSSNVAVDYTAKKNVKKPTGARPGKVIYENYRTIYVTPEESLINEIRENEKKGDN